MGEEFAYTMKAIPTTYAGTRFRSRLEARWAAFFDIRGVEWDYEPLDFDGWTPDFRLKPAGHEIFAEVKPFDLTHHLDDPELRKAKEAEQRGVYAKALAHYPRVWVMLLGIAPPSDFPALVGMLHDDPRGRAGSRWSSAFEAMASKRTTDMWREAGNKVQWNPD